MGVFTSFQVCNGRGQGAIDGIVFACGQDLTVADESWLPWILHINVEYAGVSGTHLSVTTPVVEVDGMALSLGTNGSGDENDCDGFGRKKHCGCREWG